MEIHRAFLFRVYDTLYYIHNIIAIVKRIGKKNFEPVNFFIDVYCVVNYKRVNSIQHS